MLYSESLCHIQFASMTVKIICRYVFNDSKSTRLRPDRNDYELNVQEEIQKVYVPKTR